MGTSGGQGDLQCRSSNVADMPFCVSNDIGSESRLAWAAALVQFDYGGWEGTSCSSPQPCNSSGLSGSDSLIPECDLGRRVSTLSWSRISLAHGYGGGGVENLRKTAMLGAGEDPPRTRQVQDTHETGPSHVPASGRIRLSVLYLLMASERNLAGRGAPKARDRSGEPANGTSQPQFR